MLSLRERRQLETRHLIEQVALDLFERKGVRATTVEEIAREAGVASRTFFRYFTSKDEVLFGWTELVQEFADSLPFVATSPVEMLAELEACVDAALAEKTRSPLVDREPYLRFRRLLAKDPELRHTLTLWVERVREDVFARMMARLGPQAGVLEVRLLLELAVAAVVVALNLWADAAESTVTADDEHDLLALYREARRRRDTFLGA